MDLPALTPDYTPGWRTLAVGATVRTWHQVYAYAPYLHWRLTSYWTKDGLINDGKATYRVPASAGAWWEVAWQVVAKMWRHKRLY